MAKKTYTRLFREQFVGRWFQISDEATFIEYCERFNVSRQTGYDWLEKFHKGGMDGLETRSSAPNSCPHKTDADTVKLLVDARHAHPRWGPRKLKAWLEEETPWDLELPAPSTIGDILKRKGLVPTRKRRKRVARYSSPFREVGAPNDVWTTDFKGHFRTGDRRRCYPLTVVDCFSRYLLRCDAYLSPDAMIRASFESAFVEYGLPSVIRSDNGAPFAATFVPGGLSALSVWWIRLGIIPERIAPASPWQNGRHERMHRTLEEETADPPQSNKRQQQRAFDAFRREFNHERPHEALGQKTPSTFYNPSTRSYPRRIPELEYPTGYQLRRVSDAGHISWEGRRLFVTTVLRREVVGLKQLTDDKAELYFGSVLLGTIDSTKRELRLVDPAKKQVRPTRRRRV